MSDEYLNSSSNFLDHDDLDMANNSFNNWSDDDNWGGHSWDNTQYCLN